MPDANEKALEALAEEIFELTTLSWRARTQRRAKGEVDLGESEFLAIDLLVKKAPRTVGDIQRGIGILPAQMSRVVRALESKHGRPLIACAINPDDKRRIDVRPTEAGRKAHSAFRSSRLQSTMAILGELAEADRTEFMRLLRMIRRSLANQLS